MSRREHRGRDNAYDCSGPLGLYWSRSSSHQEAGPWFGGGESETNEGLLGCVRETLTSTGRAKDVSESGKFMITDERRNDGESSSYRRLNKYLASNTIPHAGSTRRLTFGYITSEPVPRGGIEVLMYNDPCGGICVAFRSSIAPRDGKWALLAPPVTFSFTLTSNESIPLSPSAVVFRFFLAEAEAGSASAGRFLHERCLVPGRLSGPRRFGTASYTHSLFRRRQLWQKGRVESQRIFRARLGCQQIQGSFL